MRYEISLADDTKTDRNNCALNAVSIALTKPYYSVYRTFKSVGRRGGKGSSINQITRAINLLKNDIAQGEDLLNKKDKLISEWQDPTYLKISLANFARLYPAGKFIVIKSRHALALVNGVWYDNDVPNPRAYVKCFYRVE
jgi:hypothetical protein